MFVDVSSGKLGKEEKLEWGCRNLRNRDLVDYIGYSASSSNSSITIGCSWVPMWIILSFVDLLDSEVGGDVVGEDGVDGARGKRVASAASIERVGEAFRSGKDEVGES